MGVIYNKRGEECREVMRKALQGFLDDPPDSDYLRGYLEGLVVFAFEGLGMRDDIVMKASNLAYPEHSPQTGNIREVKLAFRVIDGGRDQ